MKIGIIGNGQVATRLRVLFERGGHLVVTGERNAVAPASEFLDAVAHGSVVVLAIPFRAAAAVLPALAQELQGKILVDATNPLNDDWSPLAPEGAPSAAESIQALMPQTHVVKAFNTIFADAMRPRRQDSGEPVTTGFLCGDDPDARATVAQLMESIGLAPVDAGPLLSARYLEAMAHLNIQLAVGMGGGTGAIFHYHRPTDFEDAP